MITEHQQEQAALYALGALAVEEQEQFLAEVSANVELRELVRSLQDTSDRISLTAPRVSPPRDLKGKMLARVRAKASVGPPETARLPSPQELGLRFLMDAPRSEWKQLPIAGAWIKLLSAQPDRGYAVLLGKLDPGVRYPAHINAGPEDIYILTGDLHVSDKTLGPGDFHHADAGSAHQENYSVEGCTLLAVLTMDDPLVSFAMA
ncbi:MAG TPA: cupin domain-containing protein [Candidatus Limnocylindrales bacterium]|nr:cupin domain-containing protein [Candidatus Limnocylindrales bacterium]